MKKQFTFKKSKELDNILDDIYNKLFSENKYIKFKPTIVKISDLFFDNEYLSAEEYASWGVFLAQKAAKINKPIYIVSSRKSNTYAFFINNFVNIKKILLKEQRKINIKNDLKEAIKTINCLDAAILAFLALSPKPMKDTSALNLLSKEHLSLGKCLLNIKGNYSKEVKKQANIYREWAVYKNSSDPKRKNLNLYVIAK